MVNMPLFMTMETLFILDEDLDMNKIQDFLQDVSLRREKLAIKEKHPNTEIDPVNQVSAQH